MLIKGSGIYYQFMKTADASSEQAKEKSWIPAPYNEDWENNYSTIDCSGLTKTTYVAIGIMKTDDEGNSAITEVRRVALEVNINKLKVVIDCKSELPELLEEALAEIDITYADGTTKAYKKTIGKNNKITFVDGTETLSSDYHFQWRKGATGKWVLWSDTSDQNKFSISYQTLKASNGTLYIRAFKNQDKDSQIDGLFSKEVKVKIAKTAKAPTVKIDYAKGTLAIKNGMEFRYNGKTYYVPATNKDAESEVRITDDATITTTKTKVASISLEEIVTLFNIPDGKPFVLEVRTSATEKKYASYYYKVTGLVAPSDPVGEITTELTKDSKDKPILKVSFPETDKYEYYLSSVEVTDFSAVKFTTAKATAVDIKNTANKDASTKKTLAPAAGQYLYYREAGNKNTSTFPSKTACICVGICKVNLVLDNSPEYGVENITVKYSADGTEKTLEAGENTVATGEYEIVVDTSKWNEFNAEEQMIILTVDGVRVKASDGKFSVEIKKDTTINIKREYLVSNMNFHFNPGNVETSVVWKETTIKGPNSVYFGNVPLDEDFVFEIGPGKVEAVSSIVISYGEEENKVIEKDASEKYMVTIPCEDLVVGMNITVKVTYE